MQNIDFLIGEALTILTNNPNIDLEMVISTFIKMRNLNMVEANYLRSEVNSLAGS